MKLIENKKSYFIVYSGQHFSTVRIKSWFATIPMRASALWFPFVYENKLVSTLYIYPWLPLLKIWFVGVFSLYGTNWNLFSQSRVVSVLANLRLTLIIFAIIRLFKRPQKLYSITLTKWYFSSIYQQIICANNSLTERLNFPL